MGLGLACLVIGDAFVESAAAARLRQFLREPDWSWRWSLYSTVCSAESKTAVNVSSVRCQRKSTRLYG
jgi:hypothetical protein